MADCYVYYRDAKQKLENEMEKLQRRLTHILTGQSEGSAVEKTSLEDEIEDRWKAIARLDTKKGCDLCKNPVTAPQVLRFRITHSNSMVGALPISKVHLRSECEDCCRTALPGEIVCAKLTATQERDLEYLAHKLIRQVEHTCKCRIWGTWEDLRHEAYSQTLEGRKKWYPAHVDLFGHLMMAMQNIAWGWGKESHREIPETDSLKYDQKTGEILSPFDIAESKEARLDRRLIKKEELERSFKTALVIEPDSSVLKLIKLWLERDGFKVIDILTAEEGLREYSDFSKYIRFDFVVISHLPNGVTLAMDIFRENPSQKIIITTTHASEEDVVRPSELRSAPILLKPFSQTQLGAVLQSFPATEIERAPRCRRKQRRVSNTKKPVVTPPIVKRTPVSVLSVEAWQ